MKLCNLYSSINKAHIISFDIFDTLLFRPYAKPVDLFTYMEKITTRSGFTLARCQAESKFYAQNGSSKEATFDDIYDMMPEYIDLKSLELNLEQSGLRANPEMKKAFDFALSAGKKVIITSDMYLPIDVIEKILHQNGYQGYFKLYLSNHINKRKDRGDMYDYIAQDLDVSPKTILHIGDNEKSDYRQAKEHGFQTYLYTQNLHGFLKKDKKISKFYKHYKTLPAVSIMTSLISQYQQSDDYWEKFGYAYAGPVAYAYARFIYDLAKQNHLDKVLFVARDGFLPEKVFNILSKNEIKTQYVYAPRILNYTANLDYDPNLSEQPRIICEYFKQQTGKISPAEYITQHKAEFEKLAKTEKEKTGYAKYIADLIENNEKIGVVDSISGQLSGQKLIEKESGIKTIGFYVVTISNRPCLNEFEHYDYFVGDLRDSFTLDNKCDLTELIFSAPENPIITMKNGKPVYQNVTHQAEMKRHEIYQKIEKGALAFAHDVEERLAGHNPCIDRFVIFELLRLYVTKPQKKDILAMFDVKKSPYADNSVYVPLFSAPIPCWKVKSLKKLLWRTTLQNWAIVLSCPIKFKMRGFKKIELSLFPYLNCKVFEISLFNRFRVILGGK